MRVDKVWRRYTILRNVITLSRKNTWFNRIPSLANVTLIWKWLWCNTSICMVASNHFKDNNTIINYGVLGAWHIDMNCLGTVYLYLSCNKWSCATYQNCWKEWNAIIQPFVTENQHACQSTYTERHMWDRINCAISAEWRTQTNYDHALTSNSTNA